MKTEQLKEICAMSVKLTELRMQHTPHLTIENFTPELFTDLLARYKDHAELEESEFETSTWSKIATGIMVLLIMIGLGGCMALRTGISKFNITYSNQLKP